MQDSRFCIWRTEMRHNTAGLHILDLALNETVWLMDEGMEATAPVGSVFAGRLIALDDFVMTTGAVVPMDAETILEPGCLTPGYAAKRREAVVDDARFQIGAFRAALRTGITRQIAFADPTEVQRAMATA